MTHADVNGLGLWYERLGEDGEPLLMLPGMSANHRHWGDEFVSALEAHGVAPILYDHRGMGWSERSAGPFTLADLADDAVGILDALELETAHVLGFSMGGMVAQELVLRHTERVRTLTLAGTSPGGTDSERTPRTTVKRLRAAYESGDREAIMRAGFELNVSAPFAANAANWQVFTALQGDVPAPVEVIFAQLQALVGHDAQDRLAELDVPTLVLHGGSDEVLPAHNGHLIARRVRDAKLHVFEDAGHVLMWEHPQESARLIAEHVHAGVAAGSQ